jgi:hypothetical protein
VGRFPVTKRTNSKATRSYFDGRFIESIFINLSIPRIADSSSGDGFRKVNEVASGISGVVLSVRKSNDCKADTIPPWRSTVFVFILQA